MKEYKQHQLNMAYSFSQKPTYNFYQVTKQIQPLNFPGPISQELSKTIESKHQSAHHSKLNHKEPCQIGWYTQNADLYSQLPRNFVRPRIHQKQIDQAKDSRFINFLHSKGAQVFETNDELDHPEINYLTSQSKLIANLRKSKKSSDRCQRVKTPQLASPPVVVNIRYCKKATDPILAYSIPNDATNKTYDQAMKNSQALSAETIVGEGLHLQLQERNLPSRHQKSKSSRPFSHSQIKEKYSSTNSNTQENFARFPHLFSTQLHQSCQNLAKQIQITNKLRSTKIMRFKPTIRMNQPNNKRYI